MCAIRWKWNIFTFHSKNRKSKNKFSYIKKFFTSNTVKIPCRKKGLTSKIAQQWQSILEKLRNKYWLKADWFKCKWLNWMLEDE